MEKTMKAEPNRLIPLKQWFPKYGSRLKQGR